MHYPLLDLSDCRFSIFQKCFYSFMWRIMGEYAYSFVRLIFNTAQLGFYHCTLQLNHCKNVQCYPEQKQILRACHSDPTSGHYGVTKTWKKVAEQFYWKGLINDVRQMVILALFNLTCYYILSGSKIGPSLSVLLSFPQEKHFTFLSL